MPLALSALQSQRWAKVPKAKGALSKRKLTRPAVTTAARGADVSPALPAVTPQGRQAINRNPLVLLVRLPPARV